METPIEPTSSAEATSSVNDAEAADSSTQETDKQTTEQLSDQSLENVAGGQNAERAFVDATSTVTVDRRIERTLVSEASQSDS
ncbi:MAG: hypothetical protein AAGJ95_12175 [Cyanobacteria bacterium J06554_11]